MSNAVAERETKAASIDRDLDAIERQAKADYMTAATKSAGGQSLTQAEIHSACVAYGRSVTQFHALVKIMRQRIDATNVLSTEPSTRQQNEALFRKAATIMDEIKALDADYQKRRTELANNYVHADREYQSANSALQNAVSQATQTLAKTAANKSGDIRDLYNVIVE